MNRMKKIIAIIAIGLMFSHVTVLAQQQMKEMEQSKITDGRDYLGDFAPKFAEINDDILFGQVWSRTNELSPRDRSMITIAGLMGAGIIDGSFKAHLEKAKENGITKKEIVETITQLAFYTGWPKAWAVFFLAKEIYGNDNESDLPHNLLFGLGEEQPEEYSRYFKGKSYANMIIMPDSQTKALVGNVTFEPGARNCWHVHSIEQILLATDGEGWYQEWGKPAQLLKPGDVVLVKPGVKHWHGATKDSWFTHMAIEGEARDETSEWFEMISDEDYDNLHK